MRARTKLLLSYSKGDTYWRDLFHNHLKGLFVDPWLDTRSIPDGADWKREIQKGLRESKCALVLLTPNYLERGHFAIEWELPLILAEQEQGLKLLPVLVERCAWGEIAELRKVQFMSWTGSLVKVTADAEMREELRPLKDARLVQEMPNAAISESDRESAHDKAVLEVCERVKRSFGVVGQITGDERTDLLEKTKGALVRVLDKMSHGQSVEGELDLQPIHGGDYAMVYRACRNDEVLAVKTLPTDAWRRRVRSAFDQAFRAAKPLRSDLFIRIEDLVHEPDFHALVMEYVEWPTLHQVLGGKRLPPKTVAKILEQVSLAQDNAHEHDVQLGALSPASIYVSSDWRVRLTPFRIEGQLARGVALNTGQLVNLDVLTMLTPEIYAGRQPSNGKEVDAHEQYYLGLLGLELLTGRRPVELSCFRDLDLKVKFFDNPRAYFDPKITGEMPWTEQCPALAYLLAQMLACDPSVRLPSAKIAAEELGRVANGRLPLTLRQELDYELAEVISVEFAKRFYDRLFKLRESLRGRFGDRERQHKMLADAILDLVTFRREDNKCRFRGHIQKHAALGITRDDVEAFRQAFVEEVIAIPGHIEQRNCSRGDAWNAALRLGLEEMFPDLGVGHVD